MLTRISVPLLAAAVIIFACGPRGHARDAAGHGELKRNKAVESTLRVEPGAQDVRFSLAVENGTAKQVELAFPSGKTHDFVVLDPAGHEVWRWSQSRMFTQSVQNRLVDSRDSVVYDERWHPPAGGGKFTVVALLNSRNYPMEKRLEFVLP